jgi:hypothetical protein
VIERAFHLVDVGGQAFGVLRVGQGLDVEPFPGELA